MQQAHKRQRARLNVVEYVCVAIVLLAVVALVIWVVTQAGGGVLNQG